MIYFSNKKKEDGGSILVTHDISSEGDLLIFNLDELDEKDYSVQINHQLISESDSVRILQEESYNIEKNIFKIKNNKKKNRKNSI